jgi:hypothetical protein
MESRPIITVRTDPWSAPAERTGDGAFSRFGNPRLLPYSFTCKSLNYNVSPAKSRQIAGMGEEHTSPSRRAMRRCRNVKFGAGMFSIKFTEPANDNGASGFGESFGQGNGFEHRLGLIHRFLEFSFRR